MIPVRLRSATDNSIGTTAFFRNRPLLDAVCHRLGKIDQDDIHVLFHACSIGAEVYSFLIAVALHPVLGAKNVVVSACDHEADFLELGRQGIYPKQVLSAMHNEEAACFDIVTESEVRVKEHIRRKVTFLPACSMQDFESETPMDVVFLLNALLYLPASGQALRSSKKFATTIVTYSSRPASTSVRSNGTCNATDIDRICAMQRRYTMDG